MRTFVLVLAIFALLGGRVNAQINDLPRSTPEAEGVPSKALISMFDSLMALADVDIHSVMVVRHGKVVGEIYPAPFAPQHRHTMYSCSKTFVAAAVGLAIEDNRLRLTDRVAAFFPELLPDTVSKNLSDMTVRHLLTMTSGVRPDWVMRSKTPEWIRTYLAKPVEVPGERFQYDSMATYMLSAIVQRVTGKTVLDYLRERVFTPMNVSDVGWELSPEGYNTGGWGLHIQSEALAKFGLLLLNGGVWEGRQLLSADWVKEMTSFQQEAGDEDYCYQTWRCDYPGAYRADGALGQFVIMIPEYDMVIVITECSLTNGKPQRNMFWNLLPKLSDTPLPASKDYKTLQKKQAGYQLPTVSGKAVSALSKQLEGKTLSLEKNKLGWEAVTLHFLPKEVVMTVADKSGKSYDLRFGYKTWNSIETDVRPPYSINPVDCFKGIDCLFTVAGSYAWDKEGALQLRNHYVNWVTGLNLTLKQESGKWTLTVRENYSRKPFTIGLKSKE